MAEPLRCYRHPDRETYVSCFECGRGICPDCMTQGPVGIRCPDHASAGGRTPAPKRAARKAGRSLSQYGPYVTFGIIGINVAVFLLQLAQGTGFSINSGSIFEHFSLTEQRPFSYGVGGLDEGEWWRLFTAMFLHGSVLHIALNMLVLWILGPPLEEYFGHARYAFLYVVAGLAGSAGALTIGGLDHLFNPPATVVTVGASGAIWGIMGAALLLEARRIYVFGGQAMGIVVLNLAFSFLIPGISIGGHIGGLIGGVLCALAFLELRRTPAVAALAVIGVGVLSVAVAFAAV